MGGKVFKYNLVTGLPESRGVPWAFLKYYPEDAKQRKIFQSSFEGPHITVPVGNNDADKQYDKNGMYP